MEILFLGTAAAEGIPALFCRCETCLSAAGAADIRTRCGFLINRRLMVDLTPDIMLHKLRYNLDLAALDAICFTHSHTDHLNWADLCFRCVPVYAHIPGKQPLDLYGNEKCCSVIRKGLEFDLGSPETDSLTLHEIAPGSVIQRGDLGITAFKALHDPREDCLMYLLQERDAAFLQINDSALPGEDLEQGLEEALKGRKLGAVSMDCTHGKEPGTCGHMGMGENIILKKRLVSAGLADESTRFFANHFSHNGHANHDTLSRLLAPHGIFPAFDGMLLRL